MSRTYTQRPSKQLKQQPWLSSVKFSDEQLDFYRALGFIDSNNSVKSMVHAMALKKYMTPRQWFNSIGYMLADKAPQEHQFGSEYRYTRIQLERSWRYYAKRNLKKNQYDNFENYFEGAEREKYDYYCFN